MANRRETVDTLRCPNTLTACPSPHVCDHHCAGTTHWCRDCEMRFLEKRTKATEDAITDEMLHRGAELVREWLAELNDYDCDEKEAMIITKRAVYGTLGKYDV